MVVRLDVPDFNCVEMVDDLVFERQGGRHAEFFNSIADEWRKRVEHYLECCGEPARVPKWPEIEHRKNSFINLYSSPAPESVQKAMLDTLKSHNLTLCPACGEAGRPNTLDHYLPKGLYPHFSVMAFNLFPMCDACQGKKLEKTHSADHNRFFIHPYFDRFIEHHVLVLTIIPPYNAPAFSLCADEGLPLPERTLLNKHLEELEMVPRYARFMKTQHMRLLRLVKTMRESGQDIRGTIKAFALNARIIGENYWEHIFYAAVLANDDFINYLEVEDIPVV